VADDSMALLETLHKASGDVDVLREGVRILPQAIMEPEVSELTGLPKGERDPERWASGDMRCRAATYWYRGWHGEADRLPDSRSEARPRASGEGLRPQRS